MSNFDPTQYGPVVAELLAPRSMALDAGRPNHACHDRLRALDAARLCAPAKPSDPAMARACLAALWLYHDFLDQSHRVSQSLDTAEGSYWHGIMHLREGDYSNAKYWFRRVGPHPIHAALLVATRELAAEAPGQEVAELTAGAAWDPYRFVDLCADACAGRNQAEATCRKIQEREWQLLFDHCCRRAARS